MQRNACQHDGHTAAGGSNLLKAPAAANGWVRVQKDLNLGVRKDGCADIASFHDDAAGTAELALLCNHPGTDTGMHRDARGSRGNIRFANEAGHVDAVKKDSIAIA